MIEEMRKRLEEAAEKMLNCNQCLSWIYGECKDKSKCSLYKRTLAGAELGYKEAIERAMDWLKMEAARNGKLVVIDEDLLADFENDMTKLWEGEK